MPRHRYSIASARRFWWIFIPLAALASCAGDPRPGSPEAARARRQLDFDEAGIAGVSGTQEPRPFAPPVTLPVGIR